ncbi:histidine phosphatase family protein [Vitiosangium sp. GDMCC 1.1324]|uniref:histidine phosphatase family protein n=1 Tax=Vitiosangium sp. (strain GDMCC 1.1324) TaxID=2138576 RepID=UPI000D3C07E0|nr:histidine phosphatase family protein [Vitiosangium sp. GDMCC 1.1324]PTL85590.1 histidine phosphatase family protein [Vitiosangium sp. GDMCC 1.1324]
MGAVYLVRHGQASFGAADYDALSEVGLEQARVLGEALRVRLPQVDAVFAGTLKRHEQTAQGCLASMGIPLSPHRMAGFDEFDHEEIIARFEPRFADHARAVEAMSAAADPRRAFQEMFTQAVARWTAGGHDSEYTEPWSVFQARCLRALEDIIRQLGPSKTALVFTSGGTITAICRELLQIPVAHAFRLNWTLANCGITKVIYSERGRYLSTLNEHGHFEGAQRALITYR